MAAYNVWFDKEPGRYTSPQTIGWTVSDQVDFFAISQGEQPAAISEYIAYDTLTPPNPFIAVTQDGTGNVVYDGGFPKFYNLYSPPAGINASITMEFKATCQGTSTGANLYYYNAFTDLNVTIAAGDRLVYDVFQDSANSRVGIDAITNANEDPAVSGQYNYSLRDWGQPISVLKDQNGITIHPAADLGGRAVNKWYHREFDLSACAGATFVKWSMAYEGEIAGTYATRFRDVYILDSTGKVKAVLFRDTMKLPNSSSTEAGASGYTNLSKTLYDPRSQLNGSFKYLFNAVHFCANVKKNAAGNKKILILGDHTNASSNYAVKSTDPNGFFTSMTNLCAALGFTPTFKDLGDYGGSQLNPTLAELEQYSLVLMFSTAYHVSNAPLITPAAVDAFVAYRSAGSGIIMITDHGASVITDITQVNSEVAASAGFYGTCNRIATRFGAWFTGNFDRTPVNVGFLRSTYGEHPLWAGLSDSESIIAGGSESKVMISAFTKYTKTSLPPAIQLPTPQRKVVQVTAKLKNGEAETFRVVFIYGDGALIKWVDSNFNEVTAVDTKYAWNFLVDLFLDTTGLGTLTGSIYHNTTKIGEILSTDSGGPVVTFYAGSLAGHRFLNGDVLKAALENPISASASITVSRINLEQLKGRSLAEIAQMISHHYGEGTVAGAAAKFPQRAIIAAGRGIKSILPKGASIDGYGLVLDWNDAARNIRLIKEFAKGNFPLAPLNVLLYEDQTKANVAMANFTPPTPKQIFDTWGRFSNQEWYEPGVVPPASSEASGWTWDAASNSAKSTVNSASTIGFVSKEKVEEYTHDVTLSSSNADDDCVCVVIAAAKTGNLVEHLCVVFSPGGVGAAPVTLQYNLATTGAKVLVSRSVIAFGTPNSGLTPWSGRNIRVNISRRGSSVNVSYTDWNKPAGPFVDTFTFDMASDPVLANLLGPQSYGYAAMSQPDVTFQGITFLGGVLLNTLSVASTGAVYRWNGSAWAPLPNTKLKDIYGTQRKLVSYLTTQEFYVDKNGVVTKLTDPAPMLLAPLSNSLFKNPVTNAVLSPQYKVYSANYGWQSLPANLTMYYYADMYFPAGDYWFIGAADDQLTVEIDGVVYGNLGGGYSEGAAVQKFKVTLTAGTHKLKLTNVNVPANTPGYWYMMILNSAGAIFHEPTPGTWKTLDSIG